MRITLENYTNYIPEKEQAIIYQLLIELNEINHNKYIIDNHKQMFLSYIIDETSNDYQLYRLTFEHNQAENVMLAMNIDILDSVICAIGDVLNKEN